MIYLRPHRQAIEVLNYDPTTGEIRIDEGGFVYSCKKADLIADGGQTEINDRIAEILRAREDGWSCAI